MQVSADLTPETKSRVGVQFTQFKIFGLLPITAPESAKGNLDTTFVDEELRISRGDKGLFTLRRRYYMHGIADFSMSCLNQAERACAEKESTSQL